MSSCVDAESPDSVVQALRAAIAVVVREGGRGAVGVSEDRGHVAVAVAVPAGIVKPGASAQRTAERETLAETGVRCAVREQLGSRLHPVTHVMCVYFLCDFLAGDAANLDLVETSACAGLGSIA